MVPQPHTSPSRPKAGVSNIEGHGFLRHRKPLITYGRQDKKPLCITGTHFKRHARVNAPDDENGIPVRSVPTEFQPEASTRVVEEESNNDTESELSDKPRDETNEVVAGSHTNLGRHRADCSNAQVSVGLTRTRSERDSSPRCASPSKRKAESASLTEGRGASSKRARPGGEKKRAAPTTAKTTRRLPVNELLLVATTNERELATPPSSTRAALTHDPINQCDSSVNHNSALPVGLPRSGQVREAATKQPLNISLKRHLQSEAKYRFKSVPRVRKKRSAQSPPQTVSQGDGFEKAELYISPLARRSIRKRRARQDPLISSFGALQLQSGPLPDVVFEPTCPSLELEADSKPAGDGEQAVGTKRPARHVSFSDSTREQLILAQLSAISAPAVPRPVSEGEGEPEEEAACTVVDEDQIADGFEAVPYDEVYEADTEEPHGRMSDQFERETTPIPAGIDYTSSSEATRSTSQGVSLDFRRLDPGQRPRRRIRQDDLVEVDEPIFEDADSRSSSALFSLRQTESTDHPMSLHARETVPEMPPASSSPQKRPRSILRNNSRIVVDSTTQAEHTAANTRRNSTIELSESRYFTDAPDMLRNVDMSKHRIVPRRRSSYFTNPVDLDDDEDEEVETLDSQGLVPETSTPYVNSNIDMLNYHAIGALEVLRRNSQAERTAQSLPAGPSRDLRTLTRSVSRGHGTLSQGERRQSRLPSHSPAKIS